ncbi:MAG: hypothetical protein WCY88_04485 [Spongiibacteraceae bacterium]
MSLGYMLFRMLLGKAFVVVLRNGGQVEPAAVLLVNNSINKKADYESRRGS